MKTIILTPEQLKSLPNEVREQVLAINEQSEVSIKELKSKIKSLHHNSIGFRSDNNRIDSKSLTDSCYLMYDIWLKTAGEEWGNCSGTYFKVNIGNKYIRAEVESYGTDRKSTYNEMSLSITMVNELVDLLLEAEKQESEADRDTLLIITAKRVDRIIDDMYQFR